MKFSVKCILLCLSYIFTYLSYIFTYNLTGKFVLAKKQSKKKKTKTKKKNKTKQNKAETKLKFKFCWIKRTPQKNAGGGSSETYIFSVL